MYTATMATSVKTWQISADSMEDFQKQVNAYLENEKMDYYSIHATVKAYQRPCSRLGPLTTMEVIQAKDTDLSAFEEVLELKNMRLAMDILRLYVRSYSTPDPVLARLRYMLTLEPFDAYHKDIRDAIDLLVNEHPGYMERVSWRKTQDATEATAPTSISAPPLLQIPVIPTPPTNPTSPNTNTQTQYAPTPIQRFRTETTGTQGIRVPPANIKKFSIPYPYCNSPLSLRKYGYKMHHTNAKRQDSLDKAVQAHGPIPVMERLQFLLEKNKSPLLNDDYLYVENKYMNI